MESYLEKYTILSSLGNQSKRKFSSVFLIEEIESKEKYVLKKIKKTSSNQHLVERLIQESTFNFTHQQLPSIKQTYENNSEIILIIQFINGKDLNEFWKGIKPSNYLKIWKEIVKGLISPLEYLRTNNIVHCDLKPSNIIIEEKNGKLIPHIIDFGLALRTNQLDNRKTLFPLGYAAPELILNQLNCVNHTTDLFSIGIINWVLFCNSIPLNHSNPSIMTNLQITYPIPKHVGLNKELFQLISKVCHKHSFSLPPNKMKKETVYQLLNAASSNRYQTISDYYIALENIKNKDHFIKKIINKILF